MRLPFISRKRHDAEVAHLRKLIERSLDPKFLGAEVHNNMLEVGLQGGAAQLLAAMFVRLLDERGAQNYVEVQFYDPKHGDIDVMVQRRNGKRPTDKLKDAEDLLREVKGYLRTDAYDSHKRMAQKIDALLPNGHC